MTLGIDRALIVKAVLSDGQGGVYGCEAVSSFTPDLAAVKDLGIEPLPYDPGKARELLARAGWKDSDADGVLDREGKKFEFALLTRAGSQRASDVAVLVQDHLKKIGVSVRIETPDFATMWDRLRKRTYQAAIWGVGAPLLPDPRDGWHSGEKHVFNVTGYENQKADELMDRGVLERDEAGAAAIWRELAQVIYDDQPCTFLYWFDHVAMIHARFRDVAPSPVSLLHGVEGWWVPDAEQKRKG
jgi:peptide/nickel transport system substrate-binding protein